MFSNHFEEATRETNGEYSSATVIIPVVNSLQRSLTITTASTMDNHGITRMKKEMLSSLDNDTRTWRMHKSMLWTYFDEIVKEHNSDGPASASAVEAVVDAYLHESVCVRKSSPIAMATTGNYGMQISVYSPIFSAI